MLAKGSGSCYFSVLLKLAVEGGFRFVLHWRGDLGSSSAASFKLQHKSHDCQLIIALLYSYCTCTMSTANTASGMAAGGPKAAAASTGGSSGNVAKRLQKELMQLMMSGSKEVSAFPCADNIMQWTATITGPDGSVYEGMTLKLSIAFSDQYPHKAPTIKFTTPVFHPNVDLEGNICLDILKVC